MPQSTSHRSQRTPLQQVSRSAGVTSESGRRVKTSSTPHQILAQGRPSTAAERVDIVRINDATRTVHRDQINRTRHRGEPLMCSPVARIGGFRKPSHPLRRRPVPRRSVTNAPSRRSLALHGDGLAGHRTRTGHGLDITHRFQRSRAALGTGAD